MAKGQKRSNREIKKPKKDKSAATTAPSTVITRIGEAQERAKKFGGPGAGASKKK